MTVPPGPRPVPPAPRARPTVAAGPAPGPVPPGDLTPELLGTDVWSDELVAAAGIPVVDVPFVTVGGGIGSFVTVDYLRIAGVPTSGIRVLSVLDRPWETYEYLTRVSQIPRHERLRSDSASTPDCIWGFPGYALREAWASRGLRARLAPLVQVAVEPVLADFYTPRAGAVFTALERESRRIRWPEMLAKGQVRLVRRRDVGGYFTVLTPPPGTSATRRVAYRSTWVHLAVGYPGLRFLPDLQALREAHPDRAHQVVNAYEPHEHVYEGLQRRPGSTVVVRGGGIVASRLLQRLIDDRDAHGTEVRIVHVLRTYVSGPHGSGPLNRRRGGDGWAYQGFNYPKSVWGGQLKARVRRAEGDERARLYAAMGGTNTPYRRSWQEQLRRGRAEGWYRVVAGRVLEVAPRDDGTLATRLATDGGEQEVRAAVVLDATGLEADIREHRVLADLLDHSGAGRNPLGRLDVERDFEVRGAQSPPGALFASGATTLGGYFPGVDTFLGLQVAAQEITDELASRGFCARIGPTRSVRQWLRWARNRLVD